ncbi:OLC1v1030762C1 [Oldenlandia corymbosa var. corymbosa]|uniref:OLC1v1030762C1 n=1 Tax=Oldenlandia corymbosa var. corymbosa TaxID=529605 RepID=A0AAV1CHI8_OLDCO|nr:OLC1v1030762C1 [Oldenlandia corymbosa var. corymbosa]
MNANDSPCKNGYGEFQPRNETEYARLFQVLVGYAHYDREQKTIRMSGQVESTIEHDMHQLFIRFCSRPEWNAVLREVLQNGAPLRRMERLMQYAEMVSNTPRVSGDENSHRLGSSMDDVGRDSFSPDSAGVKDGEDGSTYAVTMYFVGASFVAFVLECKWKSLSRSSNSLLSRSMSRCLCCVDKGKKSDGRFSFICVDSVDEVI